jgi:hypothetical protein
VAAGHSDLVPVWVCAVAAHMLPLASLLGDRLLVPLGGLLAAVALAALVAALATTVRRARSPAWGRACC